jgi:hypothetical protein
MKHDRSIIRVVALLIGLSGWPIADAASPTEHYWYDGDVRRPLWLDAGQVADFSEPGFTPAKVLKAAGQNDPAALSKRQVAGATSPVFKDDAGGGARVRALPGGVIVTLKQPMSEAAARAFLKQRGLTPLRSVIDGSGMWLIESGPGLESLQLANRLFESGDYATASPNWWQPRTLK